MDGTSSKESTAFSLCEITFDSIKGNLVTKNMAAIFLGLVLATSSAWSAAVTINPSIDGTIRNQTFLQGSSITSASWALGIVRFQTPTLQEGDTATLKLYPSAPPLRGPTEYVYGYKSDDLTVNPTAFNITTLLGQIDIPANSDFSSVFSLDVTNFVKSANSPYITFELRSEGLNTFTALGGYSFQKPTQLVITSIPEPGAMSMMGLGLALMVLTAKCQKRRGDPA